jgi:hypothetical protein
MLLPSTHPPPPPNLVLGLVPVSHAGGCARAAFVLCLCECAVALLSAKPTMPLRVALCVSNLQATLSHLAEQLSKAALSLRSAGRDVLTEEDVIQVGGGVGVEGWRGGGWAGGACQAPRPRALGARALPTEPRFTQCCWVPDPVSCPMP